tara:strand:- start:1818 stop:2705 length:888 start_codon:yes stop_codon:yes gene_type:complete
MISDRNRYRLVLIASLILSGTLARAEEDKPRFIERREWDALVELRKVEILIDAIEKAKIARTSIFEVRRGDILVTVTSEEEREKKLSHLKRKLEAATSLYAIVAFPQFNVSLNSGIEKGMKGLFRINEVDAPIFPVVQIIDGQTMIVESGDETCWIEGISTEGITDDSKITILEDVEVVGQKRYTTVLGSKKTVWLIKPVDLTKERQEARKRDQRKWVSSDGKHETVGSLNAVDSGIATLRLESGTLVDVPLSRLSSGDEAYAKKWAGVRGNIDKEAIADLLKNNGKLGPFDDWQ